MVWEYYYYEPTIPVDVTTAKTPLQYSPEDWRGAKIGWQRGWRYKGLLRKYSYPTKFVMDGATILRHLKYTYGIEAKAELFVEVWNPQTYTYGTLFRGDFDFSQFRDVEDGVVITVNDGGFPAKLKAREGTKYRYRIDNDPDCTWIKVPSISLQSTLFFTMAPPSVSPQAFGASLFPGIYYYDTEGTNNELVPYDVAPPTTSFFIRNGSSLTFDTDIKIECRTRIDTPNTNTNTGFFKVHRTVYNTNSGGTITGVASSTDIYVSGTGQAPNTQVTYTIDQTDTISLAPLQIVEYSFNMELSGGGGSASDGFSATIVTGKISVYHIGETDEYYVPCLPAERVYELLVESLSDGEDTGLPTLLTDDLNSEIYLTSGDGLRNLAIPYLEISMEDFFDFFDSDSGAMIDYDINSNTAILRTDADGFDYTLSQNIGNVKSCSVEPFTDLTWVNLKIGGPERELDSINGKEAVNMTSEFLSPITRIKADSNMVSGIITEMYDIVLTAQRLTDKESTDSETDSMIFAFHATSLGSPADGTFEKPPFGTVTDYYDVYKKNINLTPGPTYWEIENVFEPDKLFNVRFSPKRRLLRKGPLYRSIFYNDGTNYLKFQRASKSKMEDVRMITSEGSPVVVISEGADELISDLCSDGDLYFLPYKYEVITSESVNLYATIDSDKYKYIQFEYKGVTRTLFIIDTELTPGDMNEWKITGLMTKNDTPTNLIR